MRRTANTFLVFIFMVACLSAQETIAEGWEESLNITVHVNNGTVLGSPHGVVVTDEVSAGWDIDQDGNKEFLVLTDHSNPNGGNDEFPTGASLYLYEATSSGFELIWSWWDTTLYTGGASFPVHAVADLDGDGNQEIILGLPYGTGNPPDGSNPARFYVWEGPTLPADGTPTATWNFGVSVGSNTRPSGIAVDDIDGDGAQEVAIGFRAFSDASVNDAALIFSLDGAFAGDFTQWTEELIDTVSNFNSIYSATITDIDGDGNKEAFISSFSRDKGYVYEATGADSYELHVIGSNPNWLGGIHATGSYDVDGDGTAELFIGNGQGNAVMIDGVTDLSAAVDSNDVYLIGGIETGVRGMAVGDFDGDGNCDVFLGGNYQSSVIRLEYSGSGAVTDPANWSNDEVYQQDTSGAVRTYAVAFGGAANNGGTGADLNGDNLPDLVIGFEDGDSTATKYVVVLSYDDMLAISTDFGAPILETYKLSQNYPNPFNPTTSIEYSLTAAGNVNVKVYDIIGNHITTLVAGHHQAGEYNTVWDGKDSNGRQVASGTYIYRLEVNGASLNRYMTLVK